MFELRTAMAGAGFWCWRRTAGKGVAEGECYRLEEACNDWRRSAVEFRAAPSECTRRDRAVCFDLIDLRLQKSYYRCLFTPEECESFRAAMAEKYPEYQPGACRPAT